MTPEENIREEIRENLQIINALKNKNKVLREQLKSMKDKK